MEDDELCCKILGRRMFVIDLAVSERMVHMLYYLLATILMDWHLDVWYALRILLSLISEASMVSLVLCIAQSNYLQRLPSHSISNCASSQF